MRISPLLALDHRDLALEHLAADECDLIAERDAFRELLAVALDHLRQLTLKLTRTEDSLRRLLVERKRGAGVRPEAQAA